MSLPTIERFRDEGSRMARRLRGMARRLVVAATATEGFWQLLGYKDADGNRETFGEVELFQHVGFASRPKGSAESVVLHIGADEEHPVIVATRDRTTQVQLEADEAAIFSSGSIVKVTNDGEVRIGTADASHPLARGDAMQDTLNALITRFNAHMLIYNAHTHVLAGTVDTPALHGELTMVPVALDPPPPVMLSGPDDLSPKNKVT